MSTVLGEVSALLELFRGSDWRDLHLRTPHYSLFLAKQNGASNPMLNHLESPDTALEAAAAVVRAPHVATVVSVLSVGTQVQAGTLVGEVEVLGEHVALFAPRSGSVGAIIAPVGSLVEYDAPMLTIVAPPDPV